MKSDCSTDPEVSTSQFSLSSPVAELFLKLAMCVELIEGADALTLAVALDVGQIAAIRLLALARSQVSPRQ